MKLAINGGSPVRRNLFPGNSVIGPEEQEAAKRVLESGTLSAFYGAWNDKFYGGPEVRALEDEWAKFYNVKHAIAVNSATSGLYCAVGAIGCDPGDEIIVTPYSMCASAVAPLIFNAIPIFADIETAYFCLDPAAVEAAITPRTKAIIIVDLFGHPYQAQEINALAKKHGLYVIEDAAQAPGAMDNDRYAGTLGDVGVYSLNYHKHIHCGEGGVVVTNDQALAERVRLIRNHAEAVVGPKGEPNLVNMLGFNFRMTELEAAIARCQLRKLKDLLKARRSHCSYLNGELSTIPAIKPPATRENCLHSFYLHTLKYCEELAGVGRDIFVKAVGQELAPMELRESDGARVWSGYVTPLYLLPLFEKKIAYGKHGCPWTCNAHGREIHYRKGLCPNSEKMHYKEVIVHEYMMPGMTRKDLNDVVDAFVKVWDNRQELKS